MRRELQLLGEQKYNRQQCRFFLGIAMLINIH